LCLGSFHLKLIEHQRLTSHLEHDYYLRKDLEHLSIILSLEYAISSDKQTERISRVSSAPFFPRIQTLSSRLGLSIRPERVLSTDGCPFVTTFDVSTFRAFWEILNRRFVDFVAAFSRFSIVLPLLVMHGERERESAEREKRKKS